MKIQLKYFIFIFTAFALLVNAGSWGCINSGREDHLKSPAIVVLDSPKNRLFVIDNQNNGMNLINTTNNEVVLFGKDDDSLLDEDSPLLLPLFPANAALASLENDTSRIFVVGANETPSQQVTVLDYATESGIQLAPISPINVAGSSQDVLTGIALDSERQRLLVVNSNSAMLHVFDALSGVEEAFSPIALAPGANQLALDQISDLLVVSNVLETQLQFLQLEDLSADIKSLEIGSTSRDVSLSSNASGTLLFVSGSMNNIALVYRVDVTDPSQSDLVFELAAPLPDQEDSQFLTGNLNQISSGNLSDGRVGAYFTQSTGDLLVLNLPAQLTEVTPTRIEIGAASGEGIGNFLNPEGAIDTVYFASPGMGVLTVVAPLDNTFIDQIP